MAIPAAVALVALLLGLGIGLATRADPKTTAGYKAMQAGVSAARASQSSAEAEVSGAQESAERKAEDAMRKAQALGASEAALQQREEAIASREAAVAVAEKRIADTSIGEGMWTVGTDVEPRTYRTREPVTGNCYWGIYRSGTNGDAIIQNDIVTGGYPTVRLSAGQDFQNHGCGTFVKQ